MLKACVTLARLLNVMLKSFKINTAIIIFIAFLFRLFFINISSVSSFTTQQNNGGKKHVVSKILKRRKNVDQANTSGSRESAIEICEEGTDDEDELLKHSSGPVFFLFSFLATRTVCNKSNAFFDYIHHKISSKKYLAISVLRI